MREDFWKAVFLLVVIGSWVFGVTYGRWLGGAGSFFADLSQVVRVPIPPWDVWWKPLVYFTLTVIAFFMLSQIFFGVGAGLFVFSRGVYDSTVIAEFEGMIRSWSFPNIPAGELWLSMLFVLILVVNLPLSLWTSYIGSQRAMYTWYRLIGKPINPEIGTKSLSNFLVILAISIATGLAAALILSNINLIK